MQVIRDEKWIREHVDMGTGMVNVSATELVQLLREYEQVKKDLADTSHKLTEKLWEKG